ncbi:MAG TPA: type II secretion system F family protein [Candidatus Paceibacterota bacterium]|nr:type II secretion system F family protein [Candidatus Paceibacterota bacterium]HPT40391.1 type II secretion system F family protein [Candidatus Paceibacterota bacterium]
MLFHYTATNKEGRLIEDNGDFKDSETLLEHIKNQGLTPISIKAAKTLSGGIGKGVLGNPINLTDKIFLTKYLSLMLKSGTDLFKAIDILIADFQKPTMKMLLMEVRQNLEKGLPFYTTFQSYPNIFSPVFTSLVRAGEASGNLERIFFDLSRSLEKERELKQKIKSALTYPILLVTASLGILVLLVTFAIPRISSMFNTGDMKIPPITKAIFALSDFMSNHGLAVLGVVIAIVIILVLFFKKVQAGKKIFNRIIYKMPVISKVMQKNSYQRFCSTFGSLMRAGLPILENLEITATTVGNDEMRQAIIRIGKEGLSKGLTMGDAFRREPVFPQTIRTLVAVGEKAGHTEEIFGTLTEFYETEVDMSVKSLVSLVEPLMLLMMGVMVGGIALAVILPVYQFVGQMGGV